MSFETYILAALAFTSLFLGRLLLNDPLGSFPGPVLARWTWLYRAYYDIVVGGGWLSHLQDLHKAYGPVVRVGRNELHFSESAAYADIYTSTFKMPKDPALYTNAFDVGLPPSVFSTINPKDHSAFKSLLSSYFSRKGVLKLENVIQERVDKLISQLVQNHKTSPANMNYAFRSMTIDIITLYTLRTHLDATSYPSFHHPAILMIDKSIEANWALKHLPFIRKITLSLPTWLALRLQPSLEPNLLMQEEVERLVDKAMQDSQHPDDSSSDVNVFTTVLENARIEGKLKQANRITREWLINEGISLRIAGSDTVGNTCTIGTRCLIRDDRVRGEFVRELVTAWPDKEDNMPLERLEKLPYLTAVIKESLRVSFGVVTPMARIVPQTGAAIAGHQVPPDTVVSMANSFVHMNPEIFSDPEQFRPERWLEDKDHVLDHYLVTFGKGPRACLGINLAWSELYMIFGNIFRRLDFHSKSDLWSEVQFKELFVPLYKGDVLSATVTERV